jgi:DNA-binding response OmpR family regulator/predicted regulator of Ras-like GTPase activity (Roadblock/LC7/MglB family)
MVQPAKKVLIVDDEETLTWSMSKSLSKDRDKYSIFIGNTGKEALEVLKNNAVDLVITDIRLPDINGLDLLTAIRNDYPNTKVIIMTAYGSSDIQKEANKRGSLYYIEKPFEIADIRKLILDILWKRKGFEGNVFDLQLADVIQLNCLCRITAALKVNKGDQQGVIYFNDGNIVHAECDGQIGKEALFAILSWREGKFDHERGRTPAQNTISQNWEHLLFEGMRKKDEESSPTLGTHEMGLAASPLAGTDEESQIAQRADGEKKAEPMEIAVRSIARLAGCEGTMVVSEDGSVLAHNAIKDTVKEGALVAFLGALSHRLSETLKTGELHSIRFGRKKKKVILRNTPYYFEVHLKEGVRFDEVGPSIWRTLNSFREMHDVSERRLE